MTTTLAWHNRPDLKAEVVARMRAHRAADAIIQGHYQFEDPDAPDGYQGCAIGCTLPKIEGGLVDHWWDRVHETYGIHRGIAALIDDIFEDLHYTDASNFAVAVIEAIPVGADLDGVIDKARDRQDDPDDEVFRTAQHARDWLLRELAAAPTPEAAP